MYLIDTNILIFHINKSIPVDSRKKLRKIFKEHFNISVISRMEFLGFSKHTNESFIKASEFLEHSTVSNLDEEIVEIVINLRREKNLKLPDAIIAATALKYKWTLITRNEKDFKNIGLPIYNPFLST